MNELLINLEPRQFQKGKIIINELDEFTEVLFFNKGQIAIGFNLNLKTIFSFK